MQDYLLRVYYEDTDAQGVVYYANYLKFFERARTELLRAVGYEQMKLMEEKVIFVVRSLDLKLLKPARLDDQLVIKTDLVKLGKASFDFEQTALINNQEIAKATIKCGSLNSETFIPSALPEYLHTGMKKLIL